MFGFFVYKEIFSTDQVQFVDSSGTIFTQEEVDELNSTIKTTEEALRWTSENLYPRVAKASSFGAEDAVIMDIMIKIN